MSAESKKFGDKLEELDLSHEEIDRLTKCMKDEKFRDLLREYAEEISDPNNRKRYEEEITMLENDRGMNVKFINPKPGHVLKTSINGNQKCFINICTNENLGQPRSRPSVQGNTRGMQWSIPHSVSQAREDVDKAGTKCMVYDVVFHPDTYYLLKKNSRFKKMIHDTALDAVERQFGVELDKVNVKTPKMTFKGLPMSSVIRTPHLNGPADPKDSSSMEDVDVRLRPPFPMDEIKANGASSASGGNASKKAQPFPNLKEEVKKAKQQRERARTGDSTSKESNLELGYIEPEYSIMHRGHFDIQDYRLASDMVHDTWPKELVINIDLPLLSAANCVNLEIFERRLHLDSVKPAKYKLDFELPYPVAESKGFAKFDKSRHRLTVTLEVLPAPPPPKLLPFTAPPLVTEVEPSSQSSEEEKTNSRSDERSEPALNGLHNKESSSGPATRETTGSSTETASTDSASSVKSKPGKKEKAKPDPAPSPQPSFLEEGRRHYQQGTRWRDNDDIDERTNQASCMSVPLTKNSAFLIDMVMKYEGLIRRCPQYAFQQDEHFVSFIIEVPHIFEESLWYAVYNNMLQFCCLSECLDDDMVNSVFQLWIEFDEGCRIDPQRSRVDVSGINAVFCLRKAESNHEWHTIKAGFDKENLDTRRFSTSRNVCDLYTLVYKHAEGAEASPIAVCKVAKEEKDLLVLELEAKDGNVKSGGKNQGTGNKQKAVPKVEPAQTEENSSNQHNEHTNAKEQKEVKDSVKKEDPLPGSTNSEEGHHKKKISFADDVKKNSMQMGDHAESKDVDSDDEDQPQEGDAERSSVQKTNPVQGTVTINGSDDTKEVIVDHVTKSAVQLSTDSLIYELDDDI